MSDADEILAECVAHPDDDAPRLVWADAIGGERGELVALQLGREGLAAADLAIRNRRERELLGEHGLEWSGLDGLAWRVRYRRGFVDAIAIPADVLLAHADRIAAAAPLLTSLTIVRLAPAFSNGAHRAAARDKLERIVDHPLFERIAALDLAADLPPGEWFADAAVDALHETGVLRRLRALGLPIDRSTSSTRTFTRAAPLALERLWLRGTAEREAWVTEVLAASPKLTALAVDAPRAPLEALHLLAPNLVSLELRSVLPDDVARLAAGTSGALEHLSLVPTKHYITLTPDDVKAISRMSRLRSLELHGDLLDQRNDNVPVALPLPPLPALRELRFGWAPSAWTDEIVRVVGRQLELLDVRGARGVAVVDAGGAPASWHIRGGAAVADVPGDVIVDALVELALIHAGPEDRARWHVGLDALHPPAPPSYLVVERGPDPGRVFDLGVLGARTTRIGRAINEADIWIGDTSLELIHAEIEWRDGAHHFRGEPLRDGSELVLNDVTLRYRRG